MPRGLYNLYRMSSQIECTSELNRSQVILVWLTPDGCFFPLEHATLALYSEEYSSTHTLSQEGAIFFLAIKTPDPREVRILFEGGGDSAVDPSAAGARGIARAGGCGGRAPASIKQEPNAAFGSAMGVKRRLCTCLCLSLSDWPGCLSFPRRSGISIARRLKAKETSIGAIQSEKFFV